MKAELEQLLRRHSGDPATFRLLRHERITGGYSRLMVRAWVEDGGAERAYIVRADPPPGESIVESDRAAEWALLRALGDAIPMPRTLWYEARSEELASPVICSEMIDGPSLLAASRACGPTGHYALGAPLCELAVAIHSFDVAALPAHMARATDWDAYIDLRIEEWREAGRRYPGSDAFLPMIAAWLAANKPPPVPLGLVHGDFQTGNVVVAPDGGYRMIDWEMAHVGDPREDLGWLVLCGINQPPWLLADDPQGFFDRYAELMGYPPEAVDAEAIAYFTILGSTDVFIRVLDQLARLARGETSSAMLAYMADGVAGMESVFMDAILDHARVGGAA